MDSSEIKELLLFAKTPKLPPGVFPELLTIQPTTLPHKQTFIILHGRGRVATNFAPPLLETASTSNETIQSAFPHAKLIFPTASRNQATAYKNKLTHQWMDSWHFEDSTERQDLMVDGLNKSCNYIQDILRREIEIIGEENVVLWGLSQGGATSMSSLLTWDGKPFAAVVSMCGYLPFWNRIRDIASGTMDSSNSTGEIFDDEDPFAQSDDEADVDVASAEMKDPQMEAVTFFRDEIEIGATGTAFKQVPIFIGHGTEDDKVPFEQAYFAKNSMDLIGANAKMVEYKGLGHWYSAEMLEDIFRFLKEKLSK